MSAQHTSLLSSTAEGQINGPTASFVCRRQTRHRSRSPVPAWPKYNSIVWIWERPHATGHKFDGMELVTRVDDASTPELMVNQVRRLCFASETRMVAIPVSGMPGHYRAHRGRPCPVPAAGAGRLD